MAMEVGPQGDQVLACPRIAVSKVRGLIPQRYLERLEQNQKIPSCCRHPENHDIIALKSSPQEPGPDIYKFICTCGKVHTQFCIGSGDVRPSWQVR